MHVEGIAFYTINGKPGCVLLTFTDESAGTTHGVPIAVLRGEDIAGGQLALARAILEDCSREEEHEVAVYVGPQTTDLEVSFLWIAGFRARKVRAHEATAARGHWQLAACRHYAQAAGLVKRPLRVEGAGRQVCARGVSLRIHAAEGSRGRYRLGRGKQAGERPQDALKSSSRRKPDVV
jgi:hypothetical protein